MKKIKIKIRKKSNKQNVMYDNDNDIGKTIASLREKKKLTQKQLADATGLTRTMVNLLENGKHIPKYDTLCLILEKLGYDLIIVER